MLLVTLVCFPPWQLKMPAVKKDYISSERWGCKFCRHFPSILPPLPQKQQIFATVCFWVLLPNKDTWMHHVTYMTQEVLKGAKVKWLLHGRLAISNCALELVGHNFPSLSIFSAKQKAPCLHLCGWKSTCVLVLCNHACNSDCKMWL